MLYQTSFISNCKKRCSSCYTNQRSQVKSLLATRKAGCSPSNSWPKQDKVTLAGATDQVKCAARLYQVTETAVFHPDFSEQVSEERDEDFPGITVDRNGNVNDLFVVGNPVNCEVLVNGEAIGSFASNPQGSGVEVEVGYESVGDSHRYDVTTVTTANAPENSAIFILDGAYYKVTASPISTDDGKKKYVSGNSAGPYSSTVLVRTKPIDGITWLIRAYNKRDKFYLAGNPM